MANEMHSAPCKVSLSCDRRSPAHFRSSDCGGGWHWDLFNFVSEFVYWSASQGHLCSATQATKVTSLKDFLCCTQNPPECTLIRTLLHSKVCDELGWSLKLNSWLIYFLHSHLRRLFKMLVFAFVVTFDISVSSYHVLIFSPLGANFSFFIF